MKAKLLQWMSLSALMILLLLLSRSSIAGGEEDPKHTEVDFSISCMECHAEVTPDVYQQWRESKHGIMNYGCYMCHGDGVEKFVPAPGMEGCNGCHADQIMKLESKESEAEQRTCYSCHEVHSLKRHS